MRRQVRDHEVISIDRTFRAVLSAPEEGYPSAYERNASEYRVIEQP
jgi:hypothetical protein